MRKPCDNGNLIFNSFTAVQHLRCCQKGPPLAIFWWGWHLHSQKSFSLRIASKLDMYNRRALRFQKSNFYKILSMAAPAALRERWKFSDFLMFEQKFPCSLTQSTRHICIINRLEKAPQHWGASRCCGGGVVLIVWWCCCGVENFFGEVLVWWWCCTR